VFSDICSPLIMGGKQTSGNMPEHKERGLKNMFGRRKEKKFRKAEMNVLKARELLRYVVQFINTEGETETVEFLSLTRALFKIRQRKKETLSSAIISEAVPGSGYSNVLFIYDAQRNILTSPHL